MSIIKLINGVNIVIPTRAYNGFMYKTSLIIKTNIALRDNPNTLTIKNFHRDLNLLLIFLSEKVQFI